jgi:hypothetical protein
MNKSVILPYLSGMQTSCAVFYCHLWRVWLYQSVPHYLINSTTFGKKIIEHRMCVLIFSATLVRNVTHPTKNAAIYHHKCALVLM